MPTAPRRKLPTSPIAALKAEDEALGLDTTLPRWSAAVTQLRQTRSQKARDEIIRCQRAGYRPYLIAGIGGPIGWRRPSAS
jgi:hypothetical protein